MYKIIGYYICKPVKTSEVLNIPSDTLLSVSGCLGEIHPNLEYCFWEGNPKLQSYSDEYWKRLDINKEKQELLKHEIGMMLGKKLEVDGRFLSLTDAKYFYDSFFAKAECMIVSVSTTEEYFEILKSELQDNHFMNGNLDENEILGFDILGWDISGFHSFLCNSLNKELPTARFNDYTLLENNYEEVIRFAKQIQGKGEPVEWIPCRIGKCF